MNLISSKLKHLIPLIAFLVLASIYFGPLFTGKVLVQSDNVQLTGVSKELSEYREKGDPVTWNNKEFSGGPVLSSSEYNPFGIVSRVILNGVFPKAVMMMFLLYVGMYILLVVAGVSRWVAAIGAMAYAFSSFNVISIEVGHDNKVLAIAFMAPVIAGVMLAYRGELLKGGVLTMIAAGFQLYYGHVQITYYLLIMVLAYLLLVIHQTYKDKSWQMFVKASGVLAAGTIIAFGCNFTKLYSTLEYSDYSTRGGTDLKQEAGDNASQDGLSKDYALSWSNGVSETFTLIFPYIYGGASRETLSEDSNTYEALTSRGVDQQNVRNIIANAPLYWGKQPFTGGPIYFGAIVCFFFVLSFFVIEGPVKWWGLGLTILSLLLAMGKNLEWFTDIFFYYVPLYNKFRSITMILSIAQLIVPLMALMALDKILNQKDKLKDIGRDLIRVSGALIGLGLIMILFKGAFFDFRGLNDGAYGFPDWLVNAIVDDRKSFFNMAVMRSLTFIGLSALGVWLYLKGILKPIYFMAAMGLLVLVDLWAVDKRYLGEEDFQSKRRMSDQYFIPSNADKQILQDKSYYRVLNLSSPSPFSDGITSYHHYSILGYSAIKMQRYQELIDRYIQEMSPSVLNMLNAKYIIVKGQNGPQVQRNPGALGNAWLISEIKIAEHADEELAMLGEVNPKETAIANKEFNALIDTKAFTAEGQVSLKSYHPEKMVYDFSAGSDQFVVFSEIYYKPGWNAYIDGENQDYVRVNYVLRGLEVPKGEHEIEFRYEPVSKAVGSKVIIFSTILLVLGVGFWLALVIKKERE